MFWPLQKNEPRGVVWAENETAGHTAEYNPAQLLCDSPQGISRERGIAPSNKIRILGHGEKRQDEPWGKPGLRERVANPRSLWSARPKDPPIQAGQFAG